MTMKPTAALIIEKGISNTGPIPLDKAVSVKGMAPNTSVIMLTGFADIMETSGDNPEGVDLLLKKPVTVSSVREAIHRVRLGVRLGQGQTQ